MSELSFEQMLDETFKTIRNGEVVEGTVIDVKEDQIILNIDYKADGIITRTEYSNDQNLDLRTVAHPGDTMEAKVLKLNDGDGQVLLTYKRLAADKGNKRLEEAFENKEVLTAKVNQVLDGGLSVIVEEARVFIPASLVSDTYEKDLTKYQDQKSVSYESISQVLESYYSMKNKITLIRQKSADLRRIVTTAIERTSKKYELQQKQQKDTEKKEKYRIYGELLNTYGYHLEEGARSLEALNYYTNEMITIPLDEHLSAAENAKKYFDRYTKLKRTEEALNELLEETRSDLEHLESIRTSLDIALDEDDLVEVREELMEYGYLRRKGSSGKKKKIVSRPFHYRSADGFDIYVGKNNFQNDELSFKIASGNDWWFHAKGQPGSHVIVKSNGEELPDRTFEEAARLAAFYSKGRQAPKVEIDYTQKKNLKKPNGAKPGFVIYHTNYSMIAEPKIHEIEEIK